MSMMVMNQFTKNIELGAKMPLKCEKCSEQFEVNFKTSEDAQKLGEQLLQHTQSHKEEITYILVDRKGTLATESSSFESKLEQAMLDRHSIGNEN